MISALEPQYMVALPKNDREKGRDGPRYIDSCLAALSHAAHGGPCPGPRGCSTPGGVFHVVSRFARDEWWLDRPGARDAYVELLGGAAERSDA